MTVDTDPAAPPQSATAAREFYFEDFSVGDVFTGGHRTVTEADLSTMAQLSGDYHPLHTDDDAAQKFGFKAKVLHGPYGQAAFLGWLFESGLSRHVIAMLDMNWTFLQELTPGDEISFRMTIISKSRSRSNTKGTLGRDIEVTNDAGEVIQRGTSTVLVEARTDGEGEDLVPWAYCTVPWAERLAELLAGNPTFTQATATWDGAIGLASDRSEVILRVYRGQIIHVGTRVPHGPTFTFKANDQTWTQMLGAATNEYMVRAMKGQFDVGGNAYEDVRLTKTVMSIIESARQLIKEDNPC